MIAISNASPLMYLGKLGILDFLTKLFDSVITTSIVKEELVRQEDAPEYLVLANAFSSWLQVRDPLQVDFQTHLQKFQIHPGEASILALAFEIRKQENPLVVIIDDRSAREIASTLQIPITGTVGILLRSTRSGLLTSDRCRELLKNLLINTKFRMDPRTYAQVLSLLDEFDKTGAIRER